MKIIPVYEKKTLIKHEVKVDDEDYKKLMGFLWTWKDGYACTKINKRDFQMHRMIMGCTFGDGILIDHKDNDHHNNQKDNLRRANRFQNQQNRLTNKGNTLPKGIRLLPTGKYNVRVQAWNKRRTFGAFDTLEEAIEARNKWAEGVHGEFMRPSHLIEENNDKEVS